MMIFFAENAEKISEPQPDDFEDIETVLTPIEKLVDFAMNQPQDCKMDIKLLSILPILQRKGLILPF